MANDDRYGDRGDGRGQDRGRGDGGARQRSGYSGQVGDRGGDRGSERSGGRGYGRDAQDRDPGAHVNYYQGGDRGQQRFGPEGGFESRGDYRRTERHVDQGRAQPRASGRDEEYRWSEHGPGGSETGSLSGSGGVGGSQGNYGEDRDSGDGSAGPGFDPEFGGPRFDRADTGSVGTHGAHPVSSAYGTAQSSQGEVTGVGGGGSARERAILQQYERNQRSGRTQPRDLMPDQMGRQQGQGSQAHDPHYAEWRRRHMESLDRDYHEYSTENASRFESEFGSWRETRGQQRQAVGRATEHMEVVGSDEQHVGTVDKVAGDRIILTKRDPSAGGHHHSIPCAWIDRVEDKVVLNRTADQAQQAWRDEDGNRATFENKSGGQVDGNDTHAQDRSFSGTYRDQ